MNSLSWFLYAADTVSNLQVAFTVGAAVCFIFCFAVLMIKFITEGEYPLNENGLLWPRWAKCATAGGCLVIVAILIPQKATLYAIAASQFGEQIAKTETAQTIASDATKALHQWIKRQMEPEKK